MLLHLPCGVFGPAIGVKAYAHPPFRWLRRLSGLSRASRGGVVRFASEQGVWRAHWHWRGADARGQRLRLLSLAPLGVGRVLVQDHDHPLGPPLVRGVPLDAVAVVGQSDAIGLRRGQYLPHERLFSRDVGSPGLALCRYELHIELRSGYMRHRDGMGGQVCTVCLRIARQCGGAQFVTCAVRRFITSRACDRSLACGLRFGASGRALCLTAACRRADVIAAAHLVRESLSARAWAALPSRVGLVAHTPAGAACAVTGAGAASGCGLWGVPRVLAARGLGLTSGWAAWLTQCHRRGWGARFP